MKNQSPVTYGNKFMHQFGLDYDKYRDNNNFVEGDSGTRLLNAQAARLRQRTNSLEFE